MIVGKITNREAIIAFEVSGSNTVSQRIEAVIDTGYNGYLTFPNHLVEALRLTFAGHRRGTLADGSAVRLNVYLASVFWHGQQKDVLVSEAAGTPLVGMSMLDGSRMAMDVIDGGDVTIEALPQ